MTPKSSGNVNTDGGVLHTEMRDPQSALMCLSVALLALPIFAALGRGQLREAVRPLFSGRGEAA